MKHFTAYSVPVLALGMSLSAAEPAPVAAPAPAPEQAEQAPAATTPEQQALEAFSNGDIETLRRLLDGGMDVNTVLGDGINMIQAAFFTANVEAANLLIERGADLTCKMPNGQSLASLAAAANQPDLLMLLQEKVTDGKFIFSWKRAALTLAFALAAMVIMYLIFHFLFSLPTPKGIFGI